MLKKSITYRNPFTDEEVTEDHYFHLSQADLVELQVQYKAGWIETMQRYIAEDDKAQLLEAMKNVILKAYGKKSIDGRSFIKNEAVREQFLGTEAYSALFMELMTDTDQIIEFFNGIVPSGVGDPKVRSLSSVPDEMPRLVSLADLESMSAEELAQVTSDISTGKVVLTSKLPEPTSDPESEETDNAEAPPETPVA